MLKNFCKKNFKFGQKVKVIKTDSSMDNVEGIITGIASINWFDVYIVSLDNPFKADSDVMPVFQTFTMSESFLELVK